MKKKIFWKKKYLYLFVEEDHLDLLSMLMLEVVNKEELPMVVHMVNNVVHKMENNQIDDEDLIKDKID